jgi:hypothetical protein
MIKMEIPKVKLACSTNIEAVYWENGCNKVIAILTDGKPTGPIVSGFYILFLRFLTKL